MVKLSDVIYTAKRYGDETSYANKNVIEFSCRDLIWESIISHNAEDLFVEGTNFFRLKRTNELIHTLKKIAYETPMPNVAYGLIIDYLSTWNDIEMELTSQNELEWFDHDLNKLFTENQIRRIILIIRQLTCRSEVS